MVTKGLSRGEWTIGLARRIIAASLSELIHPQSSTSAYHGSREALASGRSPKSGE